MTNIKSNEENYALFILFFLVLNPIKNHAHALKIQHDLVVAKDGSGDKNAIIF